MSYEYMLYSQINGDASLPDWWSVTDDLSVKDHINIQASVQKWCDSSVSKTANVPVDYDFSLFKEIYINGWKSGLKGITTFRFNPEVFSGVIVRKEDLENTKYTFILDDGSEVSASGNDTIFYDGEEHNAANLFDALKEKIYGDM
jgi:ribonucleoside-diphosphate reductase alpha chain